MLLVHGITRMGMDTDLFEPEVPLFNDIPPGDLLFSEVREATPMDDNVLPHSCTASIVVPVSPRAPTADSTMVMVMDMMCAMLAENIRLEKKRNRNKRPDDSRARQGSRSRSVALTLGLLSILLPVTWG